MGDCDGDGGDGYWPSADMDIKISYEPGPRINDKYRIRQGAVIPKKKWHHLFYRERDCRKCAKRWPGHAIQSCRYVTHLGIKHIATKVKVKKRTRWVSLCIIDKDVFDGWSGRISLGM